MTRSMRTAAHYDVKNHMNPAYVKELRANLEKERQQRSDAEVMKPKTWSV